MDMIRHLTEPQALSTLADIVLVVMLVEPLALAAYRRFTGKGPTAREAVVIILPGLFLILVLKAALEGGSVFLVAALLLAAFVAHVTDMLSRFRNIN